MGKKIIKLLSVSRIRYIWHLFGAEEDGRRDCEGWDGHHRLIFSYTHSYGRHRLDRYHHHQPHCRPFPHQGCHHFHLLLLWQKENSFNVYLEVTQFCTVQLQKVISRLPQTKRRLPNLQGRITYSILRALVIINAALTISGVTMDDTELLRLANLRCSITILRSCRMAEVWEDEGGVKKPTSSFSEAL